MLGFSSWFYFCAKRWSAAFGWQRMNWTRPSGLTMWGRKSKSSGTISKVRNALSLHNFVSNQSFGNVLGWSERGRIKLTWGVINLYQSISETAATTVSRDLSFYVKQKKINSNNKWWIAKFLHYFFQLPKVVLFITFANFQLSVGWQFFSLNPLISVAGKEVICDISYEGFLIEYGFWWFLMIVDLLPSKNKLFHHILQWISK